MHAQPSSALSNGALRHGRARPGHPRGAVSGPSEAVRRLRDVDDRDEPGHDGAAMINEVRLPRLARHLGRGSVADYTRKKTFSSASQANGELAIGGRFRLLETAPDRIRRESTLILWKVGS